MRKVSVIVPCYNQAQYLSETLQSVLEQNYPHWECIIVNDGSLDNTREVAQSWLDKDIRFRYIEQRNSGLSAARNAGIQVAIGEFILPLDSDDKISREYLAEAVTVLSSDTKVKLVYCRAMMFGEINEEWIFPDYSYRSLLSQNLFFCSAIFRMSDYLMTEGYNSNMKYGYEDWDFWLNLLDEESKVERLNSFHFFYRVRKSSMIRSISEEQSEELYRQLFKNHIASYLKYFNPIKDHIHCQKLEYYARQERVRRRKYKSLFYGMLIISILLLILYIIQIW